MKPGHSSARASSRQRWLASVAVLLLAGVAGTVWLTRGTDAPTTATAPQPSVPRSEAGPRTEPSAGAGQTNAGAAGQPAGSVANTPHTDSAAPDGAKPDARSADARISGGATPEAGPHAPAFDIVRVGPQGQAVIAGRAAPNADVSVRDNGQELGHAHADAGGQWVLVPDKPLAPGAQELTLGSSGQSPAHPPTQAQDKAGAATPPGPAGDSVLLVVPQPSGTGDAGHTAIALSQPSGDATPRLLQGPAPGPGAAPLGLDVVDDGAAGDVQRGPRLVGHAPAGARLRVYLDDHAVGDARADAQGAWNLTLREPVGAGTHRLRVDQLADAADTVTARIELPYERAAAAPVLARGQIVVQPGQSLWRLARQVYGRGPLYTVIYQANREQIRDPRRIYPGQAFATPAAATAPVQ